MDIHNKIIEEYTHSKVRLEGFRDKMTSLINDLLQVNSIVPHQVSCRVKEQDSLEKKIERKKDKYTGLDEITDIVGIRIITYFEDDVDRVATMIEREFEIDKSNSIDKRVLEADKFGYRSLHYVLKLSKERTKFTENSIYKNFKAEIQIRSILQHAWAEIEHDIGYKGEIEIPRFAKRGFYRIAALLETADIEFVKLKDSLKQYESQVAKDIIKSPESVSLDKASLREYISESKIVDQIDKLMSKESGRSIGELQDDYGICLERIKYFNINTVKELDSELLTHKSIIPAFYKEFQASRRDIDSRPINKGASTFYLAYVLATEAEDMQITKDFSSVFFPEVAENVALTLSNIYKKAKQP